ncbi:MAG: aminoacyl-tRNA hydrolase [Planctomycetota bacterium]|nr:MAG: aminoacyl-tRNA hydrolase [Planctomycetota bacterium]
MRLIVGLGNPGAKYEGTRHNVGFEVLERLVRETGAAAPRTKFDGHVWECQLGGEKSLLLAPQTFMNRSGASVRKAVDFYHLPVEHVLVVCDDFNLPLGRLRMRASGSDGGQNGLADVIRCLGTEDVARLRIGIGPAPERWDPADFVLGKFAAAERAEIDLQIVRASDAARMWVTEGVAAAANSYNSKA